MLPTAWHEDSPASFKSSHDFTHIPPTSPLASFHRYHISPPIIYNVTFQNPSFPASPFRPVYYELIIWHIPVQLDPTYHQEHAKEFDTLRKWLLRVEGDDEFDTSLWGDLRRDYRGWALTGNNNVMNNNATTHPSKPIHSSNEPANNNDNQPLVPTEPSASHDPQTGESQPVDTADRPVESTHIFVLWWKDQEAAIRFKDPEQVGIKGGKIELNPLTWKTGFEDLQERWVGEGMRVENYPLMVMGWYDGSK